jgi:hypothetical protein
MGQERLCQGDWPELDIRPGRPHKFAAHDQNNNFRGLRAGAGEMLFPSFGLSVACALCVCLWCFGVMNEAYGHEAAVGSWGISLPLRAESGFMSISNDRVSKSKIPIYPKEDRPTADLLHLIGLKCNWVISEKRSIWNGFAIFNKRSRREGETGFIDRDVREFSCNPPFKTEHDHFSGALTKVLKINMEESSLLWVSDYLRPSHSLGYPVESNDAHRHEREGCADGGLGRQPCGVGGDSRGFGQTPIEDAEYSSENHNEESRNSERILSGSMNEMSDLADDEACRRGTFCLILSALIVCFCVIYWRFINGGWR